MTSITSGIALNGYYVPVVKQKDSDNLVLLNSIFNSEEALNTHLAKHNLEIIPEVGVSRLQGRHKKIKVFKDLPINMQYSPDNNLKKQMVIQHSQEYKQFCKLILELYTKLNRNTYIEINENTIDSNRFNTAKRYRENFDEVLFEFLKNKSYYYIVELQLIASENKFIIEEYEHETLKILNNINSFGYSNVENREYNPFGDYHEYMQFTRMMIEEFEAYYLDDINIVVTFWYRSPVHHNYHEETREYNLKDILQLWNTGR